MKLLTKVLFFSIVITSVNLQIAHAYVPKARNILARTAKMRSEGFYQIEKEVALSEGTQSFLFKEYWTVASANKLKVRIVGQIAEEKIDFEILYRDGRRHFFEPDGKIKAFSMSRDFIEPLLFERSSIELGQRLIKLGILPTEALQKDKPVTQLSEVQHSTEPFTRLARVLGVVTYALGESTSSPSNPTPPQIYIEQDLHQIRKITLRSGSEFLFEGYKDWVKNMNFPVQETIKWNDRTATIKTISVTPLPSTKHESAFSFEEFEKTAKKSVLKKQPTDSFAQEYFSRFR